MNEEKEKDKIEKGTPDEICTSDLIKELGMLASGNQFKSPFQYLNIIGCVEGHTVLTADNKTTKYEHLIPELIAVLVTAGLHVWKRNNLLSIGTGTILYMILIQFVILMLVDALTPNARKLLS